MKKITFLVITTVLCFFCLTTTQAQKNNKLKEVSQRQTRDNVEIAETAVKPSKFAPKGWRILKTVFGDLNNDNLPDVAIALEKELHKPSERTYEEGEGDRVLVVAFRSEEGFRKVTVARKILLGHYDGGAKFSNDDFDAVSIRKGILIIAQGQGSPDAFGYSTEKYRYQEGQFVNIGSSEENYSFPHDEPFLNGEDYNLITGYVIEKIKSKIAKYRDERKDEILLTEDEEKGVREDTKIITRRWYKLSAGKIDNAPVIDGKTSSDEWPSLAIKLDKKDNVVKGVTDWGGEFDLSAKLGAIANNGNLYLYAEVTDDQVTETDQIQLVAGKDQIIKPIEMKQIKESQGYVVEVKYSLKELEAYKVKYIDLLKVSVEVIDVDETPQKTTKIISTSCGGRKYAAGILIRPNIGLPILE